MSSLVTAKSTLLIIAVALVVVSQPIAGQVKKRLIPYPQWADERDEDEKISLELVEIRVAGRLVVLGEPFEADENWLKDMTLIVRHIGKKPIVAFGVGGELLEGVNEELPMHASFQYGIAWNIGRGFNALKQKPTRNVLKPGQTATLSYQNVGPLTRKVLGKLGEGTFRKLEFMGPAIQYSDRTQSTPVGAAIKFHRKGNPD